jgi:hypothetical protein
MDCLDDRAAEDLGNIVAAYVEFDVLKQAEPIAQFYRHLMGLAANDPPRVERDCRAPSGGNRSGFIFRENDRPIAAYDGHHVQVDFSGPHRELGELSLIKGGKRPAAIPRRENILHPANGETVFTIEHEIRSMRHPLFMRLTVNRDPGQSSLNHAPGHHAFLWATPSD